jgi:DNA-binding response OmpR family regulator
MQELGAEMEKEYTMHIGLLEDDPAIQDYLQQAFELNGYRVSIHTFGSSLLDALFAGHPVPASLPYDVVIIDLNLPGDLSGRDVIFHIRKTAPPLVLPIIIISGAAQYQLEYVQSLFPDITCMQKPFKLHVLLQMLETSKERKPAAAPIHDCP